MSTNLTTLMDELKAKWNTNTSFGRDLIHLFSGKDLEPGGVVGAGIEPGLEYYLDYGYSLSQQIDLSDYERSIVVAHEIGHNFNGTHDLAEKWWDASSGKWQYTIMWPAVMNDDHNRSYPRFSDGTRTTNSTKNNRKWMIPYSCDHLPKD